MKTFFSFLLLIISTSAFAFPGWAPLSEQAAIDAVNAAAHQEGTLLNKLAKELDGLTERDTPVGLGGTKALVLSIPGISKADSQHRVFVRKTYTDGSACPVSLIAEVLVNFEYSGDGNADQKPTISSTQILDETIKMLESCGR